MPRVVAFVKDLAGAAGLGGEGCSRLELAVEEWAVNVCRHAYGGRDGTFEVAVRARRGEVEVEIADAGPPFDPTAAPEPDVAAPIAEREPGGLGILLIRRMSDGVAYRREGDHNVVTLAFGRHHS